MLYHCFASFKQSHRGCFFETQCKYGPTKHVIVNYVTPQPINWSVVVWYPYTVCTVIATMEAK